MLVVSGVHVAIEGRVLFDTDPWRASAMNIAFTAATALMCATALFGVRCGMSQPWNSHARSDRYSFLAWLCAVAPLVVVLWSPRAFNLLSLEDRPVELVSAAANLLTAGFLVLAWKRRQGLPRIGLMVAAAAFFFVGMEEISWFQRLFNYGTPTAFAANDQGEANLHNLATDAFQSVYYLGATLLLVVLPYVGTCLGARWPDGIRRELPGKLPLTLGAVAVAYNYAETTYVASQLAFWLTIWALALWPHGPRRRWSTLLLVHVCIAQAIMFAIGADLPRDWAPSEYREMFIALGFAVWAFELHRRSEPAQAPGGAWQTSTEPAELPDPHARWVRVADGQRAAELDP